MAEKPTTCRIGIFNNDYSEPEMKLSDNDFPRSDIEGIIDGSMVIVPVEDLEGFEMTIGVLHAATNTMREDKKNQLNKLVQLINKEGQSKPIPEG